MRLNPTVGRSYIPVYAAVPYVRHLEVMEKAVKPNSLESQRRFHSEVVRHENVG